VAGVRPAQADLTRVYGENDVDVRPRRVAGASAPYPGWGPPLRRGKQVSIDATFVVTETGDVTDIRVEKGGGMLEAVLLQMSRWRYEPGMKNGVPVKVRLRFRHTYVG
jgi:outer membrane biosynthesis protein TonB